MLNLNMSPDPMLSQYALAYFQSNVGNFKGLEILPVAYSPDKTGRYPKFNKAHAVNSDLRTAENSYAPELGFGASWERFITETYAIRDFVSGAADVPENYPLTAITTEALIDRIALEVEKTVYGAVASATGASVTAAWDAATPGDFVLDVHKAKIQISKQCLVNPSSGNFKWILGRDALVKIQSSQKFQNYIRFVAPSEAGVYDATEQALGAMTGTKVIVLDAIYDKTKQANGFTGSYVWDSTMSAVVYTGDSDEIGAAPYLKPCFGRTFLWTGNTEMPGADQVRASGPFRVYTLPELRGPFGGLNILAGVGMDAHVTDLNAAYLMKGVISS